MDLDISEILVPGARRSYAVIPVPDRPGESAEQKRKPVQDTIGKFRLAKQQWKSAPSPWESPREHGSPFPKAQSPVAEPSGDGHRLEVHWRWNRGEPPSLEFDIISWNVGEVTAENTLEVLENFRGDTTLQDISVALLQESILRPGTIHRASDNWTIVASKQKNGGGVGIAHKQSLGGHSWTSRADLNNNLQQRWEQAQVPFGTHPTPRHHQRDRMHAGGVGHTTWQ